MQDNFGPAELGRLLKRLREEADLSLYELAKRSGVNRAKLLRLESGELRQATGPVLHKLADALGVELEDFYDAIWQDKDEPLPSPAIYFRSKYGLSDEQIAELEVTIKRLADEGGDSS